MYFLGFSTQAQMASSPSMDLPGVPVSTPRMGHTGLMMEPTMPRTMVSKTSKGTYPVSTEISGCPLSC